MKEGASAGSKAERGASAGSKALRGASAGAYTRVSAFPFLAWGPSLRSYLSWLRLPTEQPLWPCRPPLAEAKRLKSALRKVASVGLSVQQSTSSGREGYRTYKSLPVLT